MHKKNIQFKIVLRRNMSEPFKKFLQLVMSRNIWKNYPQILFAFIFVLFPEYEYIRIFVR